MANKTSFSFTPEDLNEMQIIMDANGEQRTPMLRRLVREELRRLNQQQSEPVRGVWRAIDPKKRDPVTHRLPVANRLVDKFNAATLIAFEDKIEIMPLDFRIMAVPAYRESVVAGVIGHRAEAGQEVMVYDSLDLKWLWVWHVEPELTIVTEKGYDPQYHILPLADSDFEPGQIVQMNSVYSVSRMAVAIERSVDLWVHDTVGIVRETTASGAPVKVYITRKEGDVLLTDQAPHFWVWKIREKPLG